LTHVSWWPALQEHPDGAVILTDVAESEKVRSRMAPDQAAGYQLSVRGLQAGKNLALFTELSLWERYVRQPRLGAPAPAPAAGAGEVK
jgi:hypothetical protein